MKNIPRKIKSLSFFRVKFITKFDIRDFIESQFETKLQNHTIKFLHKIFFFWYNMDTCSCNQSMVLCLSGSSW